MRTLLALLALALAAPPAALAGPGERAQLAVPRAVQVSVGRDHVWGSVRATRSPEMVGLEDWSSYDLNASGALEGVEIRKLATWLGRREVTHLAISVDDAVLPFPTFPVKFVGDENQPVPLDASVTVRVEGRRTLELGPGTHRYTLYDLPAEPGGFIPIRLTLVNGFRLGPAQGTRAERRGDQRFEVTVSGFTPALWGTFERLVPGGG